MKKYFVYFAIPIVLLLFFLFACGISEEEYNKLAKSNKECQDENNRLTAEIDNLKYGPERLLNAAQNNFDEQRYNDAKTNAENLLSRHPNSKEAKTAKTLLVKIKNEIAIKEQQRKARLQSALKRMQKKHDSVEEITWYKDPGSDSSFDSRMYLYFGIDKNDSLLGPRLVIRLVRDLSESWLFVKKYTLKIDDTTEEITPESYNDVKRDNNSYKLWENYDIYADANILRIINKVIKSKKTILRYVGQDYVSDHVISSSEKVQMQNVLDAYNAYEEKK